MSSSPSKRPRLDGAFSGSASSSTALASDSLLATSLPGQCFFHVIFLVDASGSMALEAGSSRGRRGQRMNRLAAVFDSIELFMGMMMGMTDILCSLATFNDTHDVKLRAEKPNARLVKKLRDIKATTKPEGGGYYVEALKAMRELCTNAVDIGVLLSDGCPSEMLVQRDSSPIDRYMEQMHAEMDSKWYLHTVGFGAFDTRCLQSLARIGKGAFHVNERLDIGELRRTFAQLSTSVSTLRRSVLTFGEAALTPLPERELEPEEAWEVATAEQLRDMAAAQWAWIMLPSEGESGKKDLQPHGNARMVRVHKKPFAQGGLRYAFHLFLGEQGSKETALHLVAKESKFEMGSKTPQAVHTAFLDNHRRAEELAKAFNGNIQKNDTTTGEGDAEAKPHTPKVQFVPAYVIQISDETASTGIRYVTAERYIPGRYVKFNGNDGYVDEDVDAEIGGTVAAFSHFTFDHTDGQELCVDVQGVGCTWTDPQLHTRDKSFGPADLGDEGMRRFFRSHNCSELCYKMQLRRVDPEELTLGGPLDPEDPRLQKKACLVCLDGERVAVCQPCGHLCFCAECIADGTVDSVTACPVCRKWIDSTTRVRARFRPPSTFVKEIAMRG